MNINEIVDVSISLETQGVTRQGFGIPLILGDAAVLSAGQTAQASSMADVVELGYLTSDEEYLAADRVFAQNPKITRVIFGKLSTPVAQVVTITPEVENSFEYVVTVDGVEYDFTSDSDATAAEIVAGLLALVNADTDAKVTASGTTTLILTADSAGDPFTYGVGDELTAVLTTPNNGIQEDLQEYADTNKLWYAIILGTRTLLVNLLAASKVESLGKLLVLCSGADAVKDGDADNILEQLESSNLDRTVFLFSADHLKWPDAGIVSRCLQADPGSISWMFKSINGIVADDLSTTESSYIRGLNGNTYESIGGVDIFREGKVVSGEFIDTIVGADWLKARIEEDILQAFINEEKIPYTVGGISIIESIIRTRLQDAVNVGFLASYTVTVPSIDSILSANKIARLLEDVEFEGVLAGAIHKVVIRGRLAA